MLRIALAAAVAVLLTACGNHQGGESDTAEAFIRLPAAGADMSAAYFSVTLDRDDRLVSAAIDGVARVELHTVLDEGGVMKMRQVTGYDVTAGEALTLRPGGNHLMLFGLERALEDGELRDVTLTFESGATEVFELPVHGQSSSHGAH